MCGRYSLSKKELRIVSRFSQEELRLFLQRRFNIAPTQNVPAIRINAGQLEMTEMRWGLQPVWSKAPLINAQTETLTQKPTFRDAFLHRRCLIPSDGFYEWRGKTPFRFVFPGEEIFFFAAIWEPWRKPTGEEVNCFCILTTAANQTVAPYHTRMPFVVNPPDYDAWLDTNSGAATLNNILQHPGGERFQAYEVSPLVNNVRNEDPKCIEAVPTLGL